MLIGNDLYSKIDQIIDRAYVNLMLTLVGMDLSRPDQRDQIEELTREYRPRALLESLYILIRNRPEGGYGSVPLRDLLSSVNLQTLPILNDAQLATMDSAKAGLLDSIENVKQDLKKQIRQHLIELNRTHRQHAAVRRISSASEVSTNKEVLTQKFLHKLLPVMLAAAEESFERSFTSTLTDIVNDATVDAATSESLMTGVPPENIQVWKEVVTDGHECRWCRKFYLGSDGKPIVFTLAELQANGSNYGKPKSEWKPVISKTHVRCKCQLFHRRGAQ